MYIPIYQCDEVYIPIYQCDEVYIPIYQCDEVYIPIYQCDEVYIPIYQCDEVYIPIYQCDEVYIPIYQCDKELNKIDTLKHSVTITRDIVLAQPPMGFRNIVSNDSMTLRLSSEITAEREWVRFPTASVNYE